jgi:hypothetical protein
MAHGSPLCPVLEMILTRRTFGLSQFWRKTGSAINLAAIIPQGEI